ncbi:MAG TPA: hypothetical protein VHV51_21565 [Polyangiaceae bacterium]|jgi:hypothetical protein|nr:hypothetical protein [Polyangiaceae bacterium]
MISIVAITAVQIRTGDSNANPTVHAAKQIALHAMATQIDRDLLDERLMPESSASRAPTLAKLGERAGFAALRDAIQPLASAAQRLD